MRKKIFFSLALAILLSGMYCIAQSDGVVTKPPANLTGAALEEVIAHIEKGKVLFKQKCAKCHGIYTNGKKQIPNFSKQELKDYNIKFIQQDPENHAFAEKMTDEELMYVIYFLQFYQRPDMLESGAK